jgi:hypothetical protein
VKFLVLNRKDGCTKIDYAAENGIKKCTVQATDKGCTIDALYKAEVAYIKK